MSFRDTYLVGTDLSAGIPRAAGVPVAIVEREVSEAHDEERRALAPFDAPSAVAVPLALAGRVLKSEIDGVADADWTRFVLAMKTAAPGAVSASNAYGMFELKPRRLADLGLMGGLRKTRSPSKRLVWAGDFIAPLKAKDFLAKPSIQYRAFVDSMKDYVGKIASGAIEVPEEFTGTTSGMLAILHRCGPQGLNTWGTAPFPDTVALYERANGVF